MPSLALPLGVVASAAGFRFAGVLNDMLEGSKQSPISKV
jgi:hypothetical protein